MQRSSPVHQRKERACHLMADSCGLCKNWGSDNFCNFLKLTIGEARQPVINNQSLFRDDTTTAGQTMNNKHHTFIQK